MSKRGRPIAGTGRHTKLAIRKDRRTAARERRAGLDEPPTTLDPERLVRRPSACGRRTVADDVDLRRVEQIMLATAHGQDPGVTTFAERVVVKGFVEQMVGNWQTAGVLPRTLDPLDLTPTDVLNRYRRWAELERLRLDPSVPWREGQSLAALLKTCGDRLPEVQAALRRAGIELPQEWEPADDQ